MVYHVHLCVQLKDIERYQHDLSFSSESELQAPEADILLPVVGLLDQCDADHFFQDDSIEL
jgi:hypothetical protein